MRVIRRSMDLGGLDMARRFLLGRGATGVFAGLPQRLTAVSVWPVAGWVEDPVGRGALRCGSDCPVL